MSQTWRHRHTNMNLLLCLTSFISLVLANDVLQYSDSDFESRVATHDLALVGFFDPRCFHCLQLAPEYENAATILKDNDPPVPLVKVDCTANTATCIRYGARDYPSLKLFRNGQVAEDFHGRFNTAGIVKYIRYRAGPASKDLKSAWDVENFFPIEEYRVIGFFRNGESELAKTYQKVADALRVEMLFAHTTEQSAIDNYSYNDDIVLFQPKRYQSEFEQRANKYNDDASVDKIKTWIQKQSLGLCSERTEENAEKFQKPLVVAYYDVDYSKNEKVTNYWRNRVMKVAKKFQDAGKEVYFAISNVNVWFHELGTFGVTDVKEIKPDFTARVKPIITARDTKERKFFMFEEFSEENLDKFVTDLLDDKLEPYLKSEPIPLSNDEPVKVAVAKNFDEIVNNEEKDVLIEFYTPWCESCKSLEPKYKELAEKLKDEPHVAIAKMDVTANELPKPYKFSEFPMIYIAPKGNKKNPQKYSGGLEVDELLQFLAKESTNGLKAYNRSGQKKKTEL